MAVAPAAAGVAFSVAPAVGAAVVVTVVTVVMMHRAPVRITMSRYIVTCAVNER